jgi:hypothetical protein
VDSNNEGYEKALEADLASWGDDLLRHITVEIDVEMGDIYEALDPHLTVTGHVHHIGEALG